MSKLKGAPVLVTGAGGFIGSHLVDHLHSQGCDVTAFVRYTSGGSAGHLEETAAFKKDDLTVILGDLQNTDAVRSAVKGNDYVFHLGALVAIPYSYTNPREYVDVNIGGTVNVLTAAKDFGVKRVVHTSTSEVYGTPPEVPIKETQKLRGQSPYAATKIGADAIAESFYLSYGLPVAILRPFNAYGPRQSTRAIIPTIIGQALKKRNVKIGSGTPTRDFTYVTDTARAFEKMATAHNVEGETINAGSGQEISIQDLAEKICELVGESSKIELNMKERVRPEKSEVMRLCADSDKAKQLLDWSPTVSLTEGLEKTITWAKEHLDQYQEKYHV